MLTSLSARGHNLETEVKLNKAQHPFSNEVSSFHTKFLSSIRFSPFGFFEDKNGQEIIAFLSGHEEELKLSLSTTKAN